MHYIIIRIIFIALLLYSTCAVALDEESKNTQSDKSIFDILFDNGADNKAKKEKSLDEQLKESGITEQHLNISEILSQMPKGDFHNNAVIKAINKKNGKMEILNISIINPLFFEEKIVIRLLSCWKESTIRVCPDSRALIEFYTVSPMNKLDKKFQGWMFSKSPSLSSYVHDKYEFILDSCNDK